MFKGLHVRLTLLYLLAALALIVLVAAGTYWLIGSYFQTTIDLALQHTMSTEFQQLAVQPSPELVAADSAWYTRRGQVLPTAVVQAFAGVVLDTRGEHDGSQQPFQIDRCHALRSDGEVVRNIYPRWYRAKPPNTATSAPNSAPTTVPDPPASSVPPITAAAIASSRISFAPPTSGCTEEARTA